MIEEDIFRDALAAMRSGNEGDERGRNEDDCTKPEMARAGNCLVTLLTIPDYMKYLTANYR